MGSPTGLPKGSSPLPEKLLLLPALPLTDLRSLRARASCDDHPALAAGAGVGRALLGKRARATADTALARASWLAASSPREAWLLLLLLLLLDAGRGCVARASSLLGRPSAVA